MQKIIQALPDTLVVGGVVAISFGASLIYLPAGFIVGGILAIAMGAVASKKAQSGAAE